MPRIDCFELIKGNEKLEAHFASVTKDMPESEQRAESIKLANEYYKIIHSEVNELNKLLKKKQVPFSVTDNSKEIERVNKEYASKIDKLKTESEAKPSVSNFDKRLNELTELLNEGRKGKDIFELETITPVQGNANLYNFIEAKNGKGDVVFNLLDEDGNVFEGTSSNWRNESIVRQDIRELENKKQKPERSTESKTVGDQVENKPEPKSKPTISEIAAINPDRIIIARPDNGVKPEPAAPKLVSQMKEWEDKEALAEKNGEENMASNYIQVMSENDFSQQWAERYYNKDYSNLTMSEKANADKEIKDNYKGEGYYNEEMDNYVGTYEDAMRSFWGTSDSPKKTEQSAATNSSKRKIRDENTRKEIDDAWQDFLGPNGLLTAGGIDPKKIEAGAKLIGLYMKAGIYKFTDIAEDAYAKFGPRLKEIFNELKGVYNFYKAVAGLDESINMDVNIDNITYDDIEYRAKQTDNPKANFITAIREKLIAGDKMTIVSIRKIATEIGLTDVQDTELQEYVEMAVIKTAKDIVKQDITQTEKYRQILELYAKQPTISMRSSERIAKQQYSTPIPISFVAGEFVNKISPRSILEPSVGNGMMVFNVDSKNVIANEIDPIRLNNLYEQGFKQVTDQDGTKPFIIPDVDAVMTNPPFGKSKAKVYGDGYKVSGLDEQMVLNALNNLAENGRAAIIIGGHTKYNPNGSLAAEKPFLNYLYNYFNVSDIINIDGGLYAKQGTSFPVRLILIDGRRLNTDEKVFAPQKQDAMADVVSSFDELLNRVNSISNERISQPGISSTISNTGQQTTQGNNQRSSDVRDQTTNTPGEVRRAESDRPSERPSGYTDANGRPGTTSGSNGQRSNVTTDNVIEGNESETANSKPGFTIQREDVLQLSDRSNQPIRTIDITAEKTEYIPQSKSTAIGSVVPTNMASPLASVLSQFGDIDAYVQSKLGYASKEELFDALAGEQIDSVAMAIYQIENGKGLIIGDQTGVGKGRQAASIVRYAHLNGYTPIFLTEKAHLFSDMYRDLKAIGSADLVPFIVNAKSADSDPTITDEDGKVVYKVIPDAVKRPILESGQLPAPYDYVVATYSQFNPAPGKPSVKKWFLANMAMGNILIMDESHNAGGQGNTGLFLQDVLPTSQGVVFLSGTFAKKPDNMPVYATKTAMSDANMSNEELINAIKSGGVPLQEIMAKNLVDIGQMIRRERDFTGVSIDWETMDQSKESHERIFDEVVEVFNDLIHFQRDHVNPVIEAMNDELAGEHGSADNTQGTADFGISNTPFASKTFNLVRQLLLSLKANDVADMVIQELKAGRKPVIGIANTMETFLADMGLNEGDLISNIDYSISLKKGLDGLFRYSERDMNGEIVQHYIPVSQLSEEGQNEYKILSDRIRTISSGITISPIDVISSRVREAGYTIGELTGRKQQLIINPDGSATVKKRVDKDKKKLARDFNSGALDVLIVNESGSTGISLHASKTFKDQRQRVMIFAQTQLNVNTEIQLRGRIDRTGQLLRGAYRYVISPVPAEQRMIMMFKAKLKSLDANTTSNQKSKTNEIEIVDFLNKYGDEIVTEYLKENRDINEKLLDPLKFDDKSDEEVENMTTSEDAATKVSGRVALLTVREQEAFYKEVSERYEGLIQYLNDNNANDLEITTLPSEAETKDRIVVVAGNNNGNPFSEDSVRETVEMNVLKKPMKAEEIKEEIRHITEGLENQQYRAKNKDAVDEYVQGQIDKESEKITADYARKEKRIIDTAVREATRQGMEQKDIHQYVREAIAAYNDSRDSRILRNTNKRMSIAEGIKSVFNSFNVGRVYPVPNSIDVSLSTTYSEGIFMGFKMKNKLNPSNITAVFATLDSRRRVEIPLSKIAYLNTILAQSYGNKGDTSIDNWDTRSSKSNRRTGYIITGNILQAYAVNEGQLVTFTTNTGALRQGILLPESYDAKEQRMRVQISAGLPRLERGESLVDASGEVSIYPSKGGYALAVPLSKKSGGKYFLDETLRDLVANRNFNQSNGAMVGQVSEDRIADVLHYLSSKHNTSIEVDPVKAKPKFKASQAVDDALNSLINNNVPTITDAAFDGLIQKLQKAFPGTKVFFDEEILKSKLRSGGMSDDLIDKAGVIYGTKFPDGSIYINRTRLNANAPIHEFSHIWEQYNPKLWVRGVDFLKQTNDGKALFSKLRGNSSYNYLTDEQVWSEALNTLIGNKGEGQFQNKNAFARFKEWMSRFFKMIGDKLGIRNLTPDDKLQDFTSKVLGNLLGGKPVVNESVAVNQSVQFMAVSDEDAAKEFPELSESRIDQIRKIVEAGKARQSLVDMMDRLVNSDQIEKAEAIQIVALYDRLSEPEQDSEPEDTPQETDSNNIPPIIGNDTGIPSYDQIRLSPNDSKKTLANIGYDDSVLEQDEFVEMMELTPIMEHTISIVNQAQNRYGDSVYEYAKGLFDEYMAIPDSSDEKVVMMIKLQNDLEVERRRIKEDIVVGERDDEDVSGLMANQVEVNKLLKTVAAWVDTSGNLASRRLNLFKLQRMFMGENVIESAKENIVGNKTMGDKKEIEKAMSENIEDAQVDTITETDKQFETTKKGKRSRKPSPDMVKSAKNKVGNIADAKNSILEKSKNLVDKLTKKKCH